MAVGIELQRPELPAEGKPGRRGQVGGDAPGLVGEVADRQRAGQAPGGVDGDHGGARAAGGHAQRHRRRDRRLAHATAAAGDDDAFSVHGRAEGGCRRPRAHRRAGSSIASRASARDRHGDEIEAPMVDLGEFDHRHAHSGGEAPTLGGLFAILLQVGLGRVERRFERRTIGFVSRVPGQARARRIEDVGFVR